MTRRRWAVRTALLPEGLSGPVVVEADDGVITAVETTSGPVDDVVLSPGFVDLQVNGGADVAVAGAVGDDWDRLGAWLARGGTTTWFPTVITTDADSQSAHLAEIAAARTRAPGGPDIGGAHLEGPMLGSRPGAHPVELVRAVSAGEVEALPDVVRIVTLGPEQATAGEIVDAFVRRGCLVSLGHTAATDDELEAAQAAGASMVTHLYNGMPPFHHRAPGPVGWALTTPEIAVSLIADGHHVADRAIALAFAAKVDGRVVLVSDAVPGPAGGPYRLEDGTLGGSTIRLSEAVRRVVATGVPLERALFAAATAPARLVGAADRGVIAPGHRADLVTLSDGLDVEATWAAGVEVGG